LWTPTVSEVFRSPSENRVTFEGEGLEDAQICAEIACELASERGQSIAYYVDSLGGHKNVEAVKMFVRAILSKDLN
jgi:hypothetical protein